jgi:hypothetical protein
VVSVCHQTSKNMVRTLDSDCASFYLTVWYRNVLLPSCIFNFFFRYKQCRSVVFYVRFYRLKSTDRTEIAARVTSKMDIFIYIFYILVPGQFNIIYRSLHHRQRACTLFHPFLGRSALVHRVVPRAFRDIRFKCEMFSHPASISPYPPVVPTATTYTTCQRATFTPKATESPLPRYRGWRVITGP